MPALSQSLIFKLPNGSTTIDSVQINYPNTATGALLYNSEKIRGDGYYGNSDGLHTAFWTIDEFVGVINIQGTLASDPQEADWVNTKLTLPTNVYSVDTTGLIRTTGIENNTYSSATTGSRLFNFTGNFVWIRAQVSNFSQGTLHIISINS